MSSSHVALAHALAASRSASFVEPTRNWWARQPFLQEDARSVASSHILEATTLVPLENNRELASLHLLQVGTVIGERREG